MFVLRKNANGINSQTQRGREWSRGRKRRFVFVSIMTHYNISANSMEHSLALEKLPGQEIPAFYETRSLITAFKEPATCLYPVTDQSSP